jgi:ABC-type Na+ efflux pump permease subunit
VNPTLIRSFLRQRLTSPMRLAMMFLFTFFPLGGLALSGQLSMLQGIAAPLAILFAAGAVGQDVSSGTLQLLLVRPVTRPAYLVSRWLGASLGAFAVTALTIVLGVLVLVLRGTPAAPVEVARVLLEAATSIAGHAVVMVMLSTLVGGLGDLAIFAATMFVAQMLQALAMLKRWDGLARACHEIQGALGPEVPLAGWAQGIPPSWFAIASWASTVTLALAVGIARLNRRELSYASD